jgi:two-component system OmpR family sensor kinase
MSLRLRLALWYGGLAGLIILLGRTHSYAVHGRAHYEETDAVLATSAEHVAAELAEARTAAQRAEVLRASALLGSVMRIYGVDGAVRDQSADGSSAPAVVLRDALADGPGPFPLVARYSAPLHQSGAHGGQFGLARGTERWRLYTLPIADRDEYLVAMAPLGRIDASVRRFGWLMTLMALVGTAVTFLAGWLLAASALRPVMAVTDAAAAIARSRTFSRRVSPDSARSPRDELGRLVATFNNMLGSLEEAYSAQQRFVSDASHELRAPLTSIQANLELLRDQSRMSAAERVKAITEAADEADRLARLVKDLLALARADAGTTLRFEEVELDRVLMDVIGDARHLVRGQLLEIGAIEPCVARGDRDRITQLLLILVDNAIKYTPAPGSIVVSLRQDAETAAFEVRDGGIGIPAADLPHVFERFYRADRARSRDPGGTGLGLSIAHWIAAEHRGTIALTSAQGGGTTATFRLPVAPAPHA